MDLRPVPRSHSVIRGWGGVEGVGGVQLSSARAQDWCSPETGRWPRGDKAEDGTGECKVGRVG